MLKPVTKSTTCTQIDTLGLGSQVWDSPKVTIRFNIISFIKKANGINLLRTISWIAKHNNYALSSQVKKELLSIFKIQKRVLLTRGRKGLILWCKNHRLALIHYLSGCDIKVDNVSRFPSGLPKIFRFLAHVDILAPTPQDIILIRLVLTCLYVTRNLISLSKVNLSTLTDRPKGLTLLEKDYLSEFWKSLGIRSNHLGTIPRKVNFTQYHMSTKAGPSGPSLWTSLVDFAILRNTNFLYDLGVIGGNKLRSILFDLDRVFSLLPSYLLTRRPRSLRRLASFPDKEGKHRVVGILDYFSQTALRPLHSYLFSRLKLIPQDCTFNQGKFKEFFHDWEYFYSYDLSAATDRFPIDLIESLLSRRFGSLFGNSWRRIMVGIPFWYQNQYYKYETGNPMGAYSSWNSFSLSHHYILFWCCKELEISWRDSKYFLLGDDILIGDHQLAKKYYETIISLGVDISLDKSHQSKTLFEFSKRLFYCGHEITPFPISSFEEFEKHPSVLSSQLRDLRKQGWEFSDISAMVEDFYRLIVKRSASNAKRNVESGYISNLMIDFMRGLISADMILNDLIRLYNLPLPELTQYQAESILSGTALEIFVDNNPLDYKEGKPLGQLAFNVVLDLSSNLEAFFEISPTFEVSHIPLLQVHGQVEESYMRLSKEAYIIDTEKDGNWPCHLRNLAMPTSDEVYYERTAKTLYRVSHVLGTAVLENLRRIRSSDL